MPRVFPSLRLPALGWTWRDCVETCGCCQSPSPLTLFQSLATRAIPTPTPPLGQPHPRGQLSRRLSLNRAPRTRATRRRLTTGSQPRPKIEGISFSGQTVPTPKAVWGRGGTGGGVRSPVPIGVIFGKIERFGNLPLYPLSLSLSNVVIFRDGLTISHLDVILC